MQIQIQTLSAKTFQEAALRRPSPWPGNIPAEINTVENIPFYFDSSFSKEDC